MTDFKRRTLYLTSGKQIKLFGNSMAIGRSLEIREGSAPNIFSCFEQQPEEKNVSDFIRELQEVNTAEDGKQINEGKPAKEEKPPKGKLSRKSTTIILNPYKLTVVELMEIADYYYF